MKSDTLRRIAILLTHKYPTIISINWSGRSYQPEDWEMDLDVVLREFDELSPIYVANYSTDAFNFPVFSKHQPQPDEEIKYISTRHGEEEASVMKFNELGNLQWERYNNIREWLDYMDDINAGTFKYNILP